MKALLVALAVAAVALVQLLVVIGYRAPEARSASTADSEFSAERAERALARVLEDGVPHPVGSDANARVRERIAAELEALGLQVERQHGVACSHFGTCAEVHNLVARLDGRRPGRPLLLVAHHDSVPAGPGAADDGAGVATLLEVARCLRADPPDQPVVLLFDDGEELGLLGAELFVRRTPWVRDVSAVVNVEARGTSGPSLLFETTGGSARYAERAASSLDRPATSSLAVAVYRRLPNDTDLTVFARHGVTGANFAFIGDVAHYHTPLDDLAHLDRRSLQHHGDNALAFTRALSAESRALGGDAVWFDLVGRSVVWWRVGATWPILLALAIGMALAGFLARKAVRGRELLRAMVSLPALLALSGALGLAIDLLAKALGALPAPWIAHPLPIVAAAWCAAVASVCAATLAAGRGTGAIEQGAALCFWWWVSAAALASQLVEASYLALVPLAATVLPALLLRWLPALSAIVPVFGAALVWLPIVHLLTDAIGFVSFAPYPLAIALGIAPLAPLLAGLSKRLRTRLAAAAALSALAAIGVAALLPPFSEDTPQRVTFALHHDADERASRWMVEAPFGEVPDAVLEAGAFGADGVAAHPWLGTWQGRAHVAPANGISLPGPELSIESTDGGRIRGRLRSKRGAELVSIHVPPGTPVTSVRLGGQLATARYVSDHRVYIWAGSPEAGVDVEIELGPGAAREILLVDHSWGLPTEGDFLVRARPRTAVASQLGDVTVVSRRARL